MAAIGTHPRRVNPLRLAVRVLLPIVAVLLAPGLSHATLLVPPPAPLQYLNQNSATSFYHSGIGTTTGTVWDTNFASYVNTGLGTNYNELAFAFMQCFGGGMIDELGALNLVPAAYTAASQWNETSWSGSRGNAGGVEQSYYNVPFAAAAGGAVVNTILQAATTGRAGDTVGPVVANPLREHPQYTSSGPIGNSITLDRVDPLNPTANNNYLAILFGGQNNDANDYNSLVRMRNALLARGYAANQIYVLYPFTGGVAKDPTGAVIPWVNADATAANLMKAWTVVAAGKTSPTTQTYYWSGPEHGDTMFDLVGYVKSLGTHIVNAVTYTFNLVNTFVNQVKTIFNYYLMHIGNILNRPFFQIATQTPISSLQVALNGNALTVIPGPSGTDLYGDGSEFDYYFALSPSDIAALATTDNFSISWSGADPGFELAGLTEGIAADGAFSDVPEPASLGITGVGLGLLAAFRRRRHGRR